MPTPLIRRFILLLAGVVFICANVARAAGVEQLREEARDLFDQKKYAESAKRWAAVASLEAAAVHPADAYWAFWRAAICESKTGEFAVSSGYFAFADVWLQKAKGIATDDARHKLRLHEVAMLNGWETACFKDGRVGLGFTLHQRAAAAMAGFLRDFHEGGRGRQDFSAEELSYWLDVQADDAKYREARGDLTGAIAVLRAALKKTDTAAADEMLVATVSRIRNNLATLFSGLGDDEEAETIYADAMASSPEGPSRDLLRLNLARLRSQAEGPSKERLAEVRALVARAASEGEYTRLMSVKRRLAVMLSAADEETESAALFEELLVAARAHHDLRNEMDILLWRAKRRTSEGRLDGLEADLLRVLAHARARGSMPDVFDVERSYARLLFKQARWSEALIIYRQALALCRGLGASALVPELLADIAAVHEKLGDRVQAERTWKQFDEHLAAHPEFKGWRRLLAMMDKLRYLARSGRADAARAYHAEVGAFVKSAGISEYRRKEFAEFQFEKEDAEPAPVAAAPGPQPVVDLQPVIARTEVGADEPGRTRFTLSNPTAATQSGTLTLSGLKVTATARDEAKGTLALQVAFAGDGEPWSTELKLAPRDQWLISLEAAPAAAGAAEITWLGEPRQTVKWTLGTKDGGTVYVINASETVLNPFYAVPVYHELYFNDPAPRAAALRVVASRPCRIEIADASGALLAVDAEGNGSFFDRGDALYAAREGFPEIAPVPRANVAAFEMQVFLLDEDARDLELAIQTRDGGEWKTQATDRIHPAKRR